MPMDGICRPVPCRCLLIAAVAAIALWVVVRFPALAPRTVLGVDGLARGRALR